jgi:hypothetical protein
MIREYSVSELTTDWAIVVRFPGRVGFSSSSPFQTNSSFTFCRDRVSFPGVKATDMWNWNLNLPSIYVFMRRCLSTDINFLQVYRETSHEKWRVTLWDATGVRLLTGGNDGTFSLRHHVQTGFGTHPASYRMGTECSYRRDKAAGART